MTNHQTPTKTIDLISIFFILRKNLLLWMIGTSLATATAIAYALLATPLYTSTSRWLPAQNDQANNLSSLANLAGLTLGMPTQQSNERFYSDILHSESILNELLQKSWPTIQGDSVSLYALYQMEPDSIKAKHPYLGPEILARYAMLKVLREESILYRPGNAALALSITTPEPSVSRSVNDFLLQKLKEFNAEDRLRSAVADRIFLEERSHFYQEQLEDKERQLLHFRKRNMGNLLSPELQQLDRQFLREVEVANLLVIEFRKRLEMAKVNELKPMPEFRVIQEPEFPVEKSYPKRTLLVILATLGGALLWAIILVSYHMLRNQTV